MVAQGRYAQRSSFAGLAASIASASRGRSKRPLAALAKRSFTTLSCGEQRRALIARSLASDARIVCLDEPAASLDIGHALELYAMLRRLACEDYAIELVLHQLDPALAHSDRALLLAGGVCVHGGATSQVVSVDPVRDVYRVERLPDSGLGFRLCQTRS